MIKDLGIFDHNGSHFSQLKPDLQNVPVAGLKSVIQRFVITLLTPVGSKKTNENFGTNLNALIGSTNIQSHQLLEVSVRDHIKSALEQMRAEDAIHNSGLSDSVGEASLEDYDIDYDKGKLYLKVNITNLNGDSYTLPLPV